MKVEPRRTCLGCRQVLFKGQLIRLVRLPDGRVSVDATGRGAGRGAYVCLTPACLEAAVKRGKLGQAFRAPVAVGQEMLALLRA